MRATTQAQQPKETPGTRLAADERDRTLRALDALLEDDEAEQQETFAFLKKSLDQDRCAKARYPSDRPPVLAGSSPWVEPSG